MDADRSFEEFREQVALTRARTLIYAASSLLAEARDTLKTVPGFTEKGTPKKIQGLVHGATEIHFELGDELYDVYGGFESPEGTEERPV